MEGVNVTMPTSVDIGKTVLKAAARSLGSMGSSGAASTSASADMIEDRAAKVEIQARRQAEAERRGAREKVEDLREDNQRRRASARVAQANSGLELSGSSLLNMTSLEQSGEDKVSRVLADSAVRQQGIVDQAAEQAQSIRLSGRSVSGRGGGLDSLLRLGSQSLNIW